MGQTKKQEKLKSGERIKIIRVLVYEGEVDWVIKVIAIRKVKQGNHIFGGKGTVTETFRGTAKEFIKKVGGVV